TEPHQMGAAKRAQNGTMRLSQSSTEPRFGVCAGVVCRVFGDVVMWRQQMEWFVPRQVGGSRVAGSGRGAAHGLIRLRETAFVSGRERAYANTSDGRIGYQVGGAGPPDVLATIPPFLPIDLMWDEPRLVRFLNGLSSFSRHIWFDSRGTGSSD